MGEERDKGFLVLVSIEPRAYRQAIGEVMGQLRPGLAVRVVEPGDLGEQVLKLNPELVLCSQPNTFTAPSNGRPSWIEYYPYAEPHEDEVLVDGRKSPLRGAALSDLLALVDRAAGRGAPS